MEVVLLIIHILASIAIVVTILLQSGKGGGLGSGFGGAGAAATQIFGGRGAGNFLSRMTVVLAAIFMTTSLTLAYLSSQPRSLMDLEADGGGGSVTEDEIIESGSGPIEGDSAPTLNDINSVPTEEVPAEVREAVEPTEGMEEPTDALEESGGEEAVDEAPGGGAAVDAPAPAPKPVTATPEEAKGAAAPVAKPTSAGPAAKDAEAAPAAAAEKSKERSADDGVGGAPVGGSPTGSTTKANAEDEAVLAPAKTDAPAGSD